MGGSTCIRRVAYTVLIVLFSLLNALLLSAGGSSESQPADPDTGTENGEEAQERTDDRLAAFVSIQPQRYFVERVGGDLVRVSVLVPPDRGPATYEPSLRQVAALAQADVYFTIGVPFEQAFMPRVKASLPDLHVVPTHAGIERRSISAHLHQPDEEGSDAKEKGTRTGAGPRQAEGEGRESGGSGSGSRMSPGKSPDPHVWLSPPLVKTQARHIRDALVELRPGARAEIEENYAAFAADIDALHDRLGRLLEPVRGEVMFVYHPSFGYFAETYGLRQEAIETGGDQPTAAQLQRIVQLAQEEGVRVIFVQPQFSAQAAEEVARAIDGAVARVNPLAADWLDNMERIARAVRRGLE